MTKEICENCKYCVSIQHSRQIDVGGPTAQTEYYFTYECHRKPPLWHEKYAGFWPAIEAFDWCGEYKER